MLPGCTLPIKIAVLFGEAIRPCPDAIVEVSVSLGVPLPDFALGLAVRAYEAASAAGLVAGPALSLTLEDGAGILAASSVVGLPGTGGVVLVADFVKAPVAWLLFGAVSGSVPFPGKIVATDATSAVAP